MSAYITLAALLVGLGCAISGSLAADTTAKPPADSAKTFPAPTGASSSNRATPRLRPAAPVRWDALDPRTIERAEKRRSIEVPSFPPERQ
jgi:hypothetical protein